MAPRSLLIIPIFRRALAAVLAAVVAAQPVLANFAEPGRVPLIPTIRIIQDIHAHAEAQRSIATALGRLQREKGGELNVGVEGAAGAFDFSPYYAFPDEGIRRAVSSQLLDESLIAGAAYAALCRPVFKLTGIEDPALYRQNVQAYLSAKDSQPRLLKAVTTRKTALTAEKAATFDAALAHFDKTVSSYREGDLPFGDYLEAVAAAAGDTGFSVEQFLVAHRMERAINFARVEAERKSFVERLVRSLSDSDVAQVRRWIEGLGEDSGAGRRFEFLFHAARARGMDLAAFPALTDYVRYLRLSEGVDPDKLFSESAEAEEAAYRRLGKGSAASAALVAKSRRVHLTEKLLRFEMTHDDWRTFEKIRPAGTELPEAALQPFEDFYRIAAQRDTALATRARRGRMDAIVVGGFHTEGLTAAFRAAGIPFEVVRPKISSTLPTDATAYLSVFAAEKTPLERLFSRFHLFLAPPEVIGVTSPLVDSGKRIAPARFVQIFRRLAQSKPELATRVDTAAERLFASIRAPGTNSRPAYTRRDLRWLTETGYLLVLAVGLAIGNDAVSLAGIAVQLIGLPLHHALTVDRNVKNPAQRFVSRFVWSFAFLAVYGAAVLFTVALGMPVGASAGIALFSAALVHWRNHIAFRLPGSLDAKILFRFLRLPMLRMSTEDRIVIGPEQQARIDAVRNRFVSAVQEWRKTPTKMEPGIDSDPVTVLFVELEASMVGMDQLRKAEVAVGVGEGVRAAGLGLAEFKVRAARDFASGGLRLASVQPASEAADIVSNLMTGMYNNVAIGLPQDEALRKINAISEGRSIGLITAIQSLLQNAIADWRSRREPENIETNMVRILKAFSFANDTASMSEENYRLASEACGKAMLAAGLTIEEVQAIVSAETERVSDMRGPIKKLLVISGATGYLTKAFEHDKGSSAALTAAMTLGFRRAATRQFSAAIALWRASNPMPEQRDAAEILKFYREALPLGEVNKIRRQTAYTGIAVAWITNALTPAELKILTQQSVLYGFTEWYSSKPRNSDILDSIMKIRDQASEPDAAAALAIKEGAESGWRLAALQMGSDAMSRLKGQAAGNAPLPKEIVRTFLPLCAMYGLRLANIADGVAEGMLSARDSAFYEGKPDEFDTDVLNSAVQMMVNVLEGRPFKHDSGVLTLNFATVQHLFDRTTGHLHDTIGLAQDEFFNGALTLHRLGEVWKENQGDADMSRRIARIWSRIPELRYEQADGSSAETLLAALQLLDFTPDQLSLRAHSDLGVQVARFMARNLDNQEKYFSDKIQDPAMQATIAVYLDLARYYAAEGKQERVDAIFEGLALAVNDPYSSAVGGRSPFFRKPPDQEGLLKAHLYALPLRDIGNAALEMERFGIARACGLLMLREVKMSHDMIEIGGWIYDIIGRADIGEDRYSAAMEDGFEYAVAMIHHELSTRVTGPEKWAAFMDRAYKDGFMFESVDGHTAGGLIFAWIMKFFQDHPQVEALLSEDFVRRVRVMRSFTALASYGRAIFDTETGKFDPASVAVAGNYIREFDANIVDAIASTKLSPAERNRMYVDALELNLEQCLQGETARLENVDSFAAMAYEGNPLLMRDAKMRARRYLAFARPGDRERLYGEVDAAYAEKPVERDWMLSIDAALYAESFAMYQAQRGNFSEAERLLRKIDTDSANPAFTDIVAEEIARAGTTPTETDKKNAGLVVNKFRFMVLTQLAGVLSGRGAIPADVADFLKSAFRLPGFQARVTGDLSRVLEPGTYNTKILLDAVEMVILGPRNGGLEPEERASLANWAYSFSPTAIARLRETWLKRTKWKPGTDPAIERVAVLMSVQPGEWPANMLIQLDHPSQLVRRKALLDAAMVGLDTKNKAHYPIFLDRQNEPRVKLHLYAAVLAGAGLSAESLQALRLARQAYVSGIAPFNYTANQVSEDLGLMMFPVTAGDPGAALKEAKDAGTGNAAKKMESVTSRLAQAADQVGGSALYKDAREMKGHLDRALVVLKSLSDVIPLAQAQFATARNLLYQGDFTAAMRALQLGLSDLAPNGRQHVDRIISEMASYTLRDNRFLLNARLTEAQRLLDEARARVVANQVYVGYLEMIVALFRYNPAEPAAAGALIRRAVDLIQLAIKEDEVQNGLGYGLAVRAAEVAIVAGPESSAEIIDALTGLLPLIGPKMSSVQLALEMTKNLASNPVAFVTWIKAQPTGDISAELMVLRVVGLARAGDQSGAMEEIERLFTQKPPQYGEAYWTLYVTEILMESPMARDAYLQTVLAMLNNFESDVWAGDARTKLLGQIVNVASSLGSADVIYVLDALTLNPAFKLPTELANQKTGILVQSEVSLEANEWIERITRMERLKPDKISALEKAAISSMKTDADKERLRDLLEAKRSGHEARKIAEAIFKEAKEDYKALRFAVAIKKVEGVSVRFGSPETEEFLANARRVEAIWNLYQQGKYEDAREQLSVMDGSDPVPTVLRNRIGKMLEAREELAQHRPQAAEVTLNGINGSMDDKEKDRAQKEVRRVLDAADVKFKAMETASNALPKKRAALDEMRKELKSALALDAEFESVMDFIVTKALTMATLGEITLAEDLLHMIADESKLFDRDFPGYSRFDKIRANFDRARALARAVYMRDWIKIQLRVLRAEEEAEEYRLSLAQPLDPRDGKLEDQMFHFDKWEITDDGLFVVESLSREVAANKAKPTKERVLEPYGQARFSSALPFQVSFQMTPDTVEKAMVTFIKNDDGRLIFAADPASLVLLRRMLKLGKKEAKMRYLKNVVLANEVASMEKTVDYLANQISALRDGRLISNENAVLGRLLGLNVSDQPYEAVEGTIPLSPGFEPNPDQVSAINAAVNPGSVVTAIQGPPGTGKTTTGVQIARLMTASRPGKKGEIVIITSQAHAGVDNVALKLKAAGVTTIRSASSNAQKNVVAELQTVESKFATLPGEDATKESRLDQLIAAIIAHQKTGQGFAYVATNSGLRGDSKCFTLLNMYLNGASMDEVTWRYRFFTNQINASTFWGKSFSDESRDKIRPVWGQEEAGQANAADLMSVYWAINPKKMFLFGDQEQLSPYPRAEDARRSVEAQIKQGMKPLVGQVKDVFTDEAGLAFETSPFEMSYAYAKKWSYGGNPESAGGILLRFLSVARRSIWIIIKAMINVFYNEKLIHRDAHKAQADWEKLRKDTVLFVNTDGREVVTPARKIMIDTKQGPREITVYGPSSANYVEAGNAVRAVTYSLNERSAKDGSRRNAGDILVLTAYSGQNRLINEVLRVIATLNDYARNDLGADEMVTAVELADIREILVRHALESRSPLAPRIGSMFDALQKGDRKTQRAEFLKAIKTMYYLAYEGDIQLSRKDLIKIKVETPADDEDGDHQSQPKSTLAEQNANVIQAKTISSVQGWERKVVIFSLVRTDSLGFLDDSAGQKKGRRLINVALSRAQEQLFVLYSNNRVPKSLEQMKARLKSDFKSQNLVWSPISRFPSSRTEMLDMMKRMASLRQAWNISLGSDAVNSFVDRRVMPVLETGLFLSVLGAGLLYGDALITLSGLFLKAVVFPSLHLIPGWLGFSPDKASPEQAGALFRLAAVLTGLYLISYAVLSVAFVSPVPALFLAMIPVVIRHMSNNTEKAVLQAPAVQKLDLDSIDRLSTEGRGARLARKLVPDLHGEPAPSLPGLRAINSGA